MIYRKRPVTIEAWQLTKENYNKGIPDFIKENSNVSIEAVVEDNKASVILSVSGSVKTLEGTMFISENDYIIKGVEGEIYPCKPDIFEKTYDLVEE